MGPRQLLEHAPPTHYVNSAAVELRWGTVYYQQSCVGGSVYQRELGEVGWVGDWRGDAVAFRFQPPPVEPCMRFSRTRLTDALHRRCSVGARQARLGLGAATIPLREIRPSESGDR